MLNKSKLAAAVGAAALALSSQAGAVVVVGGDNGWEISFDGNINAFYQVIDCEIGCTGGGTSTSEDSTRVTSGFLPAFFSFTAKSPTVNGLTGSARFSFAPTIHTGKNHTAVHGQAGGGAGGIQGATIDTREVVANIDGSFGTISFGRTLSIFGRNAILKDMTLFGTGGNIGGTSIVDNAVVTTGRVGYGYVYPDFQTRFSYKTPNMNGFQLEVGAFDPAEPGGASTLWETDTPRFEGELTYATAFSGGSFNAWVDFTWQETDQTAAGTAAATFSDDFTSSGYGIGGQIAMSGFAATGYYYDGENLGTVTQFAGAATANVAGTGYADADNDGYYVQGTYTFNGKTTVGVSYGESNLDGDAVYAEVEQDMWTVGVYHDVNSWLKLIAEYNDAETETETAALSGVSATTQEYDSFAVGAFILW